MTDEATYGSGRFCNHFIRNLAKHFIAKKYNIKTSYGYDTYMTRLGFNLFKDGINEYLTTISINDDNFMKYIKDDTISLTNNIDLRWSFFQTAEFALYLYNYLNTDDIKASIIQNNTFNDRYNNNNDLFVHVRLGDVPHLNPGFEYYNNILSTTNFTNGYISSDTITSPLCEELIRKYNLKVINTDEVTTIMFGTTCKHIVLSHGTFSWVIGILGFYSTIYYSSNYPVKWHGDIFVIPTWVKI